MNLGRRETFRGYGPEQGYEFLRSTIGTARLSQPQYRRRRWTRFLSPMDRNAIADTFSDILGDQRQSRGPRSSLSGLCGYQCDGRSHRTSAQGRQLRRDRLSACTAENNFVPEPPKNMPILFTFVFRTIQRARSHPGKSFRAGFSMRVQHESAFALYAGLTRVPFRSRKALPGMRPRPLDCSENKGKTRSACSLGGSGTKIVFQQCMADKRSLRNCRPCALVRCDRPSHWYPING